MSKKKAEQRTSKNSQNAEEMADIRESESAAEPSDSATEAALEDQVDQDAQDEAAQAARIAQLEAEKQEWQESLLRKQADFENYRRRMQKEKEDAIQFANQSLIGELLEVLDNFERALSSHREEKESSAEMQSLFEGLELVEKQLSDLLCSRWGLKAIESLGAEFDPNFHEALMMEEGENYEVPTVVESFQTGYILHGRVLRPARVKVAKPAG